MAAVRGTRRRAGNAMGRARSGILDGARRCLAERGPKGLTMVGVADLGGIAKATVYNHFRSRDELVTALAVDTVERLADAAHGAASLEVALAQVGVAAATLPELRGALGHDPSVAAALVTPDAGAAWDAAREAARTLLAEHGASTDDASTSLVLRWVTSVAVEGPPGPQIRAEAQRLTTGWQPARDDQT